MAYRDLDKDRDHGGDGDTDISGDRVYEVSNPEYIYINGPDILYGCNQDWYQIEWRRRAGCGPVAATNILFYLRKKYGGTAIPYSSDSMEETLAAMNDVFLFVRPKRRGLHTVRKFVKGMGKFGRRYGLSLWYQYIIVPRPREKRPDFGAVVRFIEEGLQNDVPVAFLNLDAGDVEDQLSSWHWVTVVGIRTVGGGSVTLSFFDQSKALEVDLGKWFDTTETGGGFAYFCRPSPRRS